MAAGTGTVGGSANSRFDKGTVDETTVNIGYLQTFPARRNRR